MREEKTINKAIILAFITLMVIVGFILIILKPDKNKSNSLGEECAIELQGER